MTKYYVLIVRTDTGEVVREMGPMDKRSAERVESGANINMNHDEFHTDIDEREE